MISHGGEKVKPNAAEREKMNTTHPYITRMERFGTLNPAELSGRRYLGICDNCGCIMMPDEADPLYCGGNMVFCSEECRNKFCEGEV